LVILPGVTFLTQPVILGVTFLIQPVTQLLLQDFDHTPWEQQHDEAVTAKIANNPELDKALGKRGRYPFIVKI
jgi:hypothetical protein